MVQKTVLITGSSRTIGLKFAEKYVKLGWNVIGAARTPATAGKVDLTMSSTTPVHLSPRSIAVKELGDKAIDVLINNAGIYIDSGTLASTTKDDLLKQFEVNTIGPFLVTRAFTLQLWPSTDQQMLSKSRRLAIDLKKDKIGAFVMRPGWVQTDMNNGSGAITTDTSVNGLVSVIGKLTLQDTGKFYNYAGKTYPW
uniref:NAD(P)-binding domain-containing protein n=1 Tax=Globisporangium ultimum (strain ATCC 200006 / CBS 805.95 / DAOM BR144) TaxID=431595 RepID=K3XCT5_GLOUD